MASYVGNKPTNGEFAKLDDISSGFNGSANTFSMTESGRAVRAGDETQLLISLNGVLQEPLTDFVLAGTNQIQFSTAPASSDSFFGIVTGNVGGTAQTLTDGIVTSSKLANTAGTGSAVQLAANTTTLTIAANGNVGVGTTSPGYNMQVNGTVDIFNVKGGTGNAFVRFTDVDASADFSIGVDDNSGAGAGAFIVYDRNNTAYRLVVDSSGNVGIGTTSPYNLFGSGNTLQVSGATGGGLRLSQTNNTVNSDLYSDSTGLTIRTATNHPMLFLTNNSEAMRIDSSGNLLVGHQTAFTTGVNGATIGQAGSSVFVRDGSSTAATVTIVKRTNDGAILNFNKDAALVGSIASDSGSILLGSGDVGVYFDAPSDRIIPMNMSTLSVRNDAIDIGGNPHRFKDLYLSGGVYLGGTGSENHLDDYEEGTWTPSFYASYGSISFTSYAVQTGSYTKIGRMVHCRFRVRATKSGSGNTGISGLPFTADSDFSVGGCFGGAREQAATGTFFQTEGVTTSGQISVLREYDNGGLPDGVIDVAGYVIYYIP